MANSYETRAMLAIRLAGARGDITGTEAVLWTRDRHTPYVPSPLLYGDRLYFLKHYQGMLNCVQAGTGATLFGPQRLPGIGNVYASLAGAAGRVYITDRNGNTAVLKHGSTFDLLAVNRLEDSFSASPAIVGREIILRGDRYLYCLAKGAGPR
ncbi:MAG: PQQ-like beta-propeller repeat protein [bacterium]|nr:PQQ-like beta-propeller repeat protein [bacterium]